MNESLELLTQALLIGSLLSVIPLSISFFVGLFFAIIQTLTQIQEQTISYFPKVISLMIMFFFMGVWMIDKLVLFMNDVLNFINII